MALYIAWAAWLWAMFFAWRRGAALDRTRDRTAAVIWRLRGRDRLSSEDAGELLSNLWGDR